MTKKKDKLKKTLVEKFLDQQQIAYKPLKFSTVKKGGIARMDTSVLKQDEHLVYKTLVCTGNLTGPIVGVVPVTEHLALKKLARVSGNKKCEMLPLKKLVATTGYVHGANTPIGIYEKHHFPIFLDLSMKNELQIAVSSGEVGRSIFLNPNELQKVTHGTFADLLE